MLNPARKLLALTKNDTTDLTANNVMGLYVGGTGDVAVQTPSDSAPVIFKTVPAGAILPVRVKFLMSTNTTATNIVGLCG